MRGSIEEQLVVLTKETIDCFLSSENPADVMALYTFYYYSAKWQSTNQPKCTTAYVANGLKWSEAKVRKSKKDLIEMGLIEDVQSKDENGRISGHFIKLNYIVKQSTLPKFHTIENPQCGEVHSVDCRETNALNNNNINALSSSKGNALNTGIVKDIVDFLNQQADCRYKADTPKTVSLIKARMAEGFTVEDFKTVINHKVAEWKGTDMEKFLRPETLFGTKFESYLNQKPKQNNNQPAQKQEFGYDFLKGVTVIR